MPAVIRARLRRRLSAPEAHWLPYRLTALNSAPGFNTSAWLPGEVMARFFHSTWGELNIDTGGELKQPVFHEHLA